ncbi:hypothetical protein [Tautonia sociabilis]|uniref:Uncharacterized protein n=1 Tax=Tautonia sociabilis TaxID=2080755 RepID=A0A432MGE1_9BACT|nr:hypothetical protein [Tautonia sociabilis]RUL85734.1 hypothetical protein TsocGM_17840 [Tautonia sociabilis]
MSLTPRRVPLGPIGVRADEAGADASPAFRPEAEAALARFRARRDELQRGVRRGELTPRVARRLAAEAAAALRSALAAEAETFSPTPRAFLDRLAEAADDRRRAREAASLEALQRETNRLLRDSLIEQQLRNREDEFRARTYTRRVAGGDPSPTLDGLLRFHEDASLAGDEAALEWARRQLEAFRPLAPDPDDQRKIDLATDRPDRVNPRLVSRYVEQLDGAPPDDLEAFARHALEARDANACVAAFVLARQAPEGTALGLVRQVLDGLSQFPDAAIATLRCWEADARSADAAAAIAEAERVASIAEQEAALPGVAPPTEAELDRLARIESLPLAAPDEPIGLVPVRRGLSPEEFQTLESTSPEPADAPPAAS